MGVIVNNGHAACLAHQIETTTDALEIRKRRSGSGGIFAKRPQDRNHTCGIERVMDARVALQFDIDHSAIGEREREQRTHAMRAVVRNARVAVLAKAIGNHAAAALLGKLYELGVLAAHDNGTFLGHRLHELQKRRANFFDAARVVIQMVGLDIGNERDIGRQVQERTVALVGLDNVIIALA